MEYERHAHSGAGRLVPLTTEEHGKAVDYFAFVPTPLPTEVTLAPATWSAVIDAAHRLGRLDAMARELLPDPMLVARPMIRQEAVSTSALEGTFAPAADVLSSEVDAEQPRSLAVTEVLNFIRATEHGIARLPGLPVSVRLACELQRILVQATPSEDWQAGHVRKTQVIIGPYKGCSVRDAHFVPPPPGEELADGLDAWEHWIHDDDRLHPIIRVALGHYQFEALHPFTDGNGRIGRLLAILQLMEDGLLGAPLVNLSPYFEVRDEQYRHLLREVSASEAYDEWVTFFCEALETQAAEGEARIRALLDWRNRTVAMLKGRRAKGVALDIVAGLIEHPTVTVKQIAAKHGVTIQAANSAVSRLVALGVLRESTGRVYNRVFLAPDVFDIVFPPVSRRG